MVIQKLTLGLGGLKFPDAIWVLWKGGKTVIFCQSLNLCGRVVRFLRQHVEGGTARKHVVIRMYSSLSWPEDNDETERLLKTTTSDCRVAVSTVKFGAGVHCPGIDTVVNLGNPTDLDDLAQKAGRAGRDGKLAQAITYVKASVLKKAKAAGERGYTGGGVTKKRGGRRKGSGENEEVDMGKAVIYNTTGCLVAALNKLYENPGESSSLSCFEALCPAPCGNCLPWNTPSPPTPSSLTMASTPALASPVCAPAPKPKKPIVVPKQHRQLVTDILFDLRDSLYRHADVKTTGFTPVSTFLPDFVIQFVLANFKVLLSKEAIMESSALANWKFREEYADDLLSALQKCEGQITKRKPKTTAASEEIHSPSKVIDADEPDSGEWAQQPIDVDDS